MAQSNSTAKFMQGGSKMTLLSEIYKLEATFKDEIAKLISKIEDQDVEINTEGNTTNNNKNVAKSLFGDAISATSTAAGWSFDKIGEALPSCKWKPLGVRNMPPLVSSSLAQEALQVENMTTFSRQFLMGVLGGDEWSPGFYHPAEAAKEHSKQLKKSLKSKSYYLIDEEFDPFVPKKPAEHGSKLTVFFRDNDTDYEDLYNNVPLFVALPGQTGDSNEKQYTYLGTYSQLRWSDKLDFDRVQEVVPAKVKEYWAKRLADPKREGWLERALMEQFWPMPKYDGPVPTESTADSTTVTGADGSAGRSSESDDGVKDIKYYIGDLVEWEKDAKMKVGLLKKENILEAFTKEDAAEEPGLRFWWEYLQCVGFDRNFYYLLSTAQREAAEPANDNADKGAC